MSFHDEQEPIAIIGAACRLPGEVSSLGSLWDMMKNVRTGHGEVPSDRWDGDKIHHPDPDRKGNMAVKAGYFLQQDVSQFDAPFFSTTAKEAAALDPMKRLLLEVSYESLENAGISMKNLVNSDTGCYVGCMTNDYEMLSTQDIQDMGYSAATGLSEAMISNRVSWFFGLRGPSLTLDTACSSSLYALHLACQALKLGETSQALVAGVNLILYPNTMEQFSGIHMLSPEGISHSFDDRANGYGRGEGIGCMVVKRLSDALRDGDTIRAVIRHTGVNADGKTPSITQPSTDAQADLIRKTYKAAGLSLSSTEYFESHGTGTPVGDPIELRALAATIVAARREAGLGPLYFGSVKPSVGHTEGCSGLAGVFKSIMCLEKGKLVPTYGVESINPKLTLDEWNLALPSGTMPWPSRGRRRISVNSFGFGGANAHVILDDAYHYLADRGLTGNHNTIVEEDDTSESGISVGTSTPNSETSADDSTKNRLFVFSAQDQAGVKRMADVYKTEVALSGKDKTVPHYLRDLCYTLAERRTHHDFRTFAVASSLTELGTELSRPIPKPKRVSRRAKNLAFVFTGQGAQWPAMGRELMSNPVFERSVKDSQVYLEKYGCKWNAIEELAKKEDSNIGLPEYSQTLCTVLQVALVDLLRYWGIFPTGTVGHSSGEIAAAYAASYISHSDAIKIAYVRGVSSASVTLEGGMMAAGLSREEAEEYLSRKSGEVVVACVNSPKSVTLSGDADAIDALAKEISADEKFARKLKVKTAYHSPHMRQVSETYFKNMGEIETLPGTGPVMFSSLTGKVVAPEELTAQYWVDNMCNAVEFSAAVDALLAYTGKTGDRAKATPLAWSGFIELGPHSALQGPVQQNIEAGSNAAAKEAPYMAMVLRGEDASKSALAAAGKLWASGVEIDLEVVNGLKSYAPGQRPKALADLPTYPWNHGRGYWHEASETKSIRFPSAPRTDLLGMPENVQNHLQPRWKNYLRLSENPWIEDHKITGTILYPGAGMLVMALEAALQVADPNKKVRGFRFRNIAFERGLVVPSGDEESTMETSLNFVPSKSTPHEFHFTVFSYNGSQWTQHCNGTISTEYDLGESEVDGLSEDPAWSEQCKTFKSLQNDAEAEELDPDDFYEALEGNGMEYGPLFRNVESLHCVPSKVGAYGTIVIPDTESVMPGSFEYRHIIHPATMDAIFHLLLAAAGDGRPTQEAAVPFALEDMFVAVDQIHGPGSKYQGYSCLTSKAPSKREVSLNLIVSDEQWSTPKIIASGFSLRQVTSADSDASAASDPQASLKKTAQISWRKDMDLEQPETTGDEKAAYTEWLDLLTHKRVVRHALVVLDDEKLLVPEILSDIQARVDRKPGFAKLTSVATSDAILKKLQSDSAASFTDATVWNVSAGEDFPAANTEYDLVLGVGCGTLAAPEKLAAINKSLAQNGHVALISSDASQVKDVKKSMEELQWAEKTVRPDLKLVFASKTSTEAPALPSEIHLLTTPTQTEKVKSFISHISDALASSDVQVKIFNVGSDDVKTLADQYVISLLEVDTPFIYGWNEEQFLFFKTLVATAKYMLWISAGSLLDAWANGIEFAAAQGLLRVMRNEYPFATLPHLDVSKSFDIADPTYTKSFMDILKSSMVEGAEMEYAEFNGAIHIPRAVEHSGVDHDLQLASGTAKPVQLPLSSISHPMKAISTLANGELLWENADADAELQPTQVEIKVECFGVAGPQGSLDDSEMHKWTNDAVGVVERCGADVQSVKPGDRVVAYQADGYATHLRVEEGFVAPVPAGMPAETAAALPTVSVAAQYALLRVADLSAGQTVLVHNAASALGQAAIQVARTAGAEVFALVESKYERELLVDKLGVEPTRIFDSTRPYSVNRVALLLQGRGIDVIVSNKNSTPALSPSLNLLAEFGFFLDLSTGTTDGMPIGLPTSKRNASSIRLDVVSLKRRNPGVAKSLFRNAMTGETSSIHPIKTYPITGIATAVDAIKSQQLGSHVSMLDNASSIWTAPPPVEKLQLDPSRTYVLAGGLGAVGLNIANMMADSGAKHLVFLSRSGGDKNKEDLERFENQGILAEAFKCNVNDKDSVQSVFDELRGKGHVIGGIVQCAMVLNDSIFEYMSHEKWTRAFEPKSKGSRNLLGQLSAADSPFFILLSSITGVIGNTAQANYASGNTVEDALALHARTNLGIAATSLDVGLVTDSSHFTASGAFGDLKDYLHRYQHGWVGMKVTIEELFIGLKASMRGTTTDGSSVPPQIVFGISDSLVKSGGSTGFERDRKFVLRLQAQEGDSGDQAAKVNVADMLSKAASITEAASIVEDVFKGQIALDFGVDAEEIDTQRSLPELGVDSLKAVEIRNRALKDMGSDISVFELLSATPLSDVSMKIASRSEFVKKE